MAAKHFTLFKEKTPKNGDLIWKSVKRVMKHTEYRENIFNLSPIF